MGPALCSFQMLTSMFLKPAKVLIGPIESIYLIPQFPPPPSKPSKPGRWILGEVLHTISIQIFPYDNCSN